MAMNPSPCRRKLATTAATTSTSLGIATLRINPALLWIEVVACVRASENAFHGHSPMTRNGTYAGAFGPPAECALNT